MLKLKNSSFFSSFKIKVEVQKRKIEGRLNMKALGIFMMAAAIFFIGSAVCYTEIVTVPATDPELAAEFQFISKIMIYAAGLTMLGGLLFFIATLAKRVRKGGYQ